MPRARAPATAWRDDAAVRCPICEAVWPATGTICLCGYSPNHADLSLLVVRLRRSRRAGLTKLAGGLAILAAVVPWFLLLHAPGGMVVAAFASSLQAVGGLILATRGAVGLRTASRRLAAARRMMQLPAARVIR